MNIQDLLQSTTEITLDMGTSANAQGLMGLSAGLAVGGLRHNFNSIVGQAFDYDTATDTINANGTTGVEFTKDNVNVGGGDPSPVS